MKRLLKIMSVLMLTSVTTVNVVGCDFFQDHYPPVDKQQRLIDAANLIANNRDTDFVNFLQNNKQKTIKDFKTLIMNNIADLFKSHQQQEDFSNITYVITNETDSVNLNTVGIKLLLSLDGINKDCTFNANFKSLQDYVDNKLGEYVKGKAYFTLDKKEKDGLYDNLKAAGANFKTEESFFTNSSDLAKAFWKRFQEVLPPKIEEQPLGGYVVMPVLNFIGDSPYTGLNPYNFKPVLFAANNNVIAITGKKKFPVKIEGKTTYEEFEYIKIALEGQNSDTIDFGNTYHNLTFIFQ